MGILAAVLVILTLVVLAFAWRAVPRRPIEPGFKYVYVNQDGSARELSPAEQTFLSEEFAGGDSGRPYIKFRYRSRDGWGSLSGFIERRLVPARLRILPVDPAFDVRMKERGFDWLGSHRDTGDIIEKRADGSIACTPNPKISGHERFELIRRSHLADQRERELLAHPPHFNSEASA